MPSQLTFPICIVMERIAIDNRWQSHRWQPAGILPDDSKRTEMQTLRDEPTLLQQLWPGFTLTVFADESEGYYLNVTAPEPRVFVLWRAEESTDYAFPHRATLSYNEAARWMDAQEIVDGVPMPAELLHQLSEWVKDNYDPPRKKERIRPRSFESKEGRYNGEMSS